MNDPKQWPEPTPEQKQDWQERLRWMFYAPSLFINKDGELELDAGLENIFPKVKADKST